MSSRGVIARFSIAEETFPNNSTSLIDRQCWMLSAHVDLKASVTESRAAVAEYRCGIELFTSPVVEVTLYTFWLIVLTVVKAGSAGEDEVIHVCGLAELASTDSTKRM